ncbi:MAG: DUF3501 family protein [Gemmataceae bacterium]
MDALSLDDLMPLEEFAARRREFLADHLRYLDRYRRVRLGPRATLVFENRQTAWFRLQEVLRVARLSDPTLVRLELELFNHLLPRGDRLQAALVLHVEEARLAEELAPWQELRGDQLVLHVGAARHPANLLTCRPEDRCVGTAHWVQFVLDGAAQTALGQRQVSAHLSVHLPGYAHDSGPLSDDVRRSLIEDLELGARDAAA